VAPWHPAKVRAIGRASRGPSPAHVSSGIYLARLGFYDGLTFHRLYPQFMAQGGDPGGSSQGPGYRIDAESENGLEHDKPGILSMARIPDDPNSAGSQFFITFQKTPGVDHTPDRPGYTVWGEVVEGMATVRELEKRASNENNNTPKTPIKIVKTWVSCAPKVKAGAKPKMEAKSKSEEKPKEGAKK
jgi:cyclophilin family peptidyl-prolyl cis-trans isomerase